MDSNTAEELPPNENIWFQEHVKKRLEPELEVRIRT